VCPSKTQSLKSLIHKALPLSYDNGSIQNNDWDSHLQASLDAQSLWSLSENMDSSVLMAVSIRFAGSELLKVAATAVRDEGKLAAKVVTTQ
jgi:hypothetical protein